MIRFSITKLRSYPGKVMLHCLSCLASAGAGYYTVQIPCNILISKMEATKSRNDFGDTYLQRVRRAELEIKQGWEHDRIRSIKDEARKELEMADYWKRVAEETGNRRYRGKA
jgi:hypothetical protein